MGLQIFRVGSYLGTLKRKTWKPSQSMQTEDIHLLNNFLDNLAKNLAGLEWMVAGGLSIPLTTGKFYRNHEDLDILVKKEHLSGLVKAIQTSGYALFSRKACSQGGPKHFVICL